jgi:hypothetical protein
MKRWGERERASHAEEKGSAKIPAQEHFFVLRQEYCHVAQAGLEFLS